MDKLLIADSSRESVEELTALLEKQYEITTSTNGKDLLEQLRSQKPQILILELSLPEMDGLEVLKRAQAFLPPVILALAAYPSDYVICKAISLGVGHVMVRTCDLRSIREPLEELVWMAKHPKERVSTPQSLTLEHMRRLGFVPGAEGFHQIRLGIPLLVQDPAMVLGKELYPQICQCAGGGDPRAAEHNIRRSIHDAYSRGDPQIWKEYFPYCAEKAPTNSEFLFTLALMVERQLRSSSAVRTMEEVPAATLGNEG